MVGKLGVPKVKYEINPCGGAVVPRLMVKRIIKNNTLVLLQMLYFITHPHTSSLYTNQWQVDPKLFPSWPIVLNYVCSRCYCAKEAMQVRSRYEFFHDFDCVGHLSTVIFKFYVVQVKVKHVPVATICS